MKYFKQLLCLMMALLMISLTFAACGEDPAEPEKNSDTTVADGTGITLPSTNETTSPTKDETTAPTGSETTAPTENETEPPVTEPPVTEPPETVPPCEIHTFAAEKLCTEERVCTLCGETIPAGEHTYYGYCTTVRPCVNCDYECPAAAEHIMGAVYACETQKCENCEFAIYGKRCDRETLASACKICGLTPPSAIPFITIDGIAIKEFTIITSKDTPAGYGEYLSAALRHKLNVWHNVTLTSVTDDAEKSGPEIRIGKTNRTVGTVKEGELLIQVVNGDLEILCDGLSAYEALLDWMSNTFSSTQSEGLIFPEGTVLSESYDTWEADATIGDVRVMYHNILGAVDGQSSTLRTSFYNTLYDHYKPDVIGMQETHPGQAYGPFFGKGNNYLLKKHLEEQGYRALSTDCALAIFYNANTLELLEENYINTRGAYGTTWALFRHKETGKVFGFTNSHFSANSTTNNDPVLGNEARVNDAKSVVQAINAMIAAARKANVENPESIPVIAGGDYNCRVIDDPIQTVIKPAQLTNVRELVEDPTMVDDKATFGNNLTFNTTFQYHQFTTSVVNDGAKAIDHCYIYNPDKVVAEQYRVISRSFSGGCSDHHAHYVDITFK